MLSSDDTLSFQPRRRNLKCRGEQRSSSLSSSKSDFVPVMWDTYRRILRQDGKIQCPHCPKTYTALTSLERHLPIHTGNYRFWCHICAKEFSRKETYEDHMRKHEGRLHVCEYCTKSFQSSRSLELHLPVHTGKYPISCQICAKGFNFRRELEKHEQFCFYKV